MNGQMQKYRGRAAGIGQPPVSYKDVRKNKLASRILWGVMLAGVILALASGIWLAVTLFKYHAADSAYRTWAENAVKLDSAADGAEQDLTVAWKQLQQINPDIKLWLYSDAGISYPVVQGGNNSYYLRRMLDGTYNIAGSIFMDYRNTANLSDRHNVIYGHNMKDGSMLSSMVQYAGQEYYEAHPNVQLATPAGQYEVRIFAAYEQYVGDGYDMVLNFEDDAAFLEYVKEAKGKSDFSSGVEVSAEDRIVTFVLCTDEGLTTTRYFVVGKLVEVK